MKRLRLCPAPSLLTDRLCSDHASHTTIYVTDLDKRADFYERIIQIAKIAEAFHDNAHIWFKAGDHFQLHVVKGAKEKIPQDIYSSGFFYTVASCIYEAPRRDGYQIW